MGQSIQNYTYKGLTPNREGDIIGYALMKPAYIKEDLSEAHDECIHIMLNAPPLKDIAAIRKIETEVYIAPIIYTKYGNYLGEEVEWFTPIKLT